MKVDIELNFPDDRTFLNFWDINGDDVVCEIKNDKLMLQQADDSEFEISINDFCKLVKNRINSQEQ